MSYAGDSLKMCIDCKHSKCYQSNNKRNVWFLCLWHGVVTHYNETCGDWDKDKEPEKELYDLKDFPRFPQTPSSPSKAGIP